MSDLEDKFDEKIKKKSFKYKKRKTKRTIIKPNGKIHKDAVKGKVISTLGRLHQVKIFKDSKIYNAVTAGIVISKNDNQSIVAVGDIVYVVVDNKTNPPTAIIVKVEERKTHFSRKAIGYNKEHVIASNIENLIIFMSADKPHYNRRLIDRFLVSAELNSLTPIICINKIDLGDDDDLRDDFIVYQELGIKVVFLSAKYDDLSEVKAFLKNKVSVLAGPSGSGKSTFLNNLLGINYQDIREVSDKTSKGKHTTSFVRMFELSKEGAIIDTPGLREFAIWGLEKDELALYFHEFDKYNERCKYNPCTHIHEPDCAVIEAVELGDIDFKRYESYLYLYDTIDEQIYW